MDLFNGSVVVGWLNNILDLIASLFLNDAWPAVELYIEITAVYPLIEWLSDSAITKFIYLSFPQHKRKSIDM